MECRIGLVVVCLCWYLIAVPIVNSIGGAYWRSVSLSQKPLEVEEEETRGNLSNLFLVDEMKFHHNRFFEGTQSLTVDDVCTITQRTNHDTNDGDFYSCLRPFFVLGQILGVIPISGLWDKSQDLNNIYFRWNSLAILTSVPILVILFANGIFSFLDLFKEFGGSGGSNASEMASAARGPLFYSMGVFVYTFFLIRSKTLIQLFSRWRKVTLDLGFKDKDTKLFQHGNLAAAVIFTSGMIENLIITLKHFPVERRDEEQLKTEWDWTPLETYFWRSHKSWATYISYNPIVSLVLLLIDSLALYAWNYADIFIILCSRALYFKFKILVHQTENQLLNRETTLFKKMNGQTWGQVRKDHLTLCKLLDEFEVFLSPLIFVSYSMNIFFICLQLHQGLTPQAHQSVLDSTFSAWSFAHIIFRILAVSLTAAKVNEYAHEITSCIQRCSTTEYCKELERLERMLATGPIGLSGLGCFVITRAFLLMVVSVIFTVEIVLLQASASTLSASQQLPAASSTSLPELLSTDLL